MNVKKITRQGLIAGIYVVLTILSESFGLGYGSLQFRLSETLAIFCLLYTSRCV